MCKEVFQVKPSHYSALTCFTSCHVMNLQKSNAMKRQASEALKLPGGTPPHALQCIAWVGPLQRQTGAARESWDSKSKVVPSGMHNRFLIAFDGSCMSMSISDDSLYMIFERARQLWVVARTGILQICWQIWIAKPTGGSFLLTLP